MKISNAPSARIAVEDITSFTPHMVLAMITAAIVGTLVACGYCWIDHAAHHFAQQATQRIGRARFIIAASVILALMLTVFPHARFAGEHELHELTAHALDQDGATLLAGVAVKIIAVILTVRAGWRGGVVFPLLLVGAASGIGCALLLPAVTGTSVAVAAMAGCGAVLTAVTRKPLMVFFAVVARTGNRVGANAHRNRRGIHGALRHPGACCALAGTTASSAPLLGVAHTHSSTTCGPWQRISPGGDWEPQQLLSPRAQPRPVVPHTHITTTPAGARQRRRGVDNSPEPRCGARKHSTVMFMTISTRTLLHDGRFLQVEARPDAPDQAVAYGFAYWELDSWDCLQQRTVESGKDCFRWANEKNIPKPLSRVLAEVLASVGTRAVVEGAECPTCGNDLELFGRSSFHAVMSGSMVACVNCDEKAPQKQQRALTRLRQQQFVANNSQHSLLSEAADTVRETAETHPHLNPTQWFDFVDEQRDVVLEAETANRSFLSVVEVCELAENISPPALLAAYAVLCREEFLNSAEAFLQAADIERGAAEDPRGGDSPFADSCPRGEDLAVVELIDDRSVHLAEDLDVLLRAGVAALVPVHLERFLWGEEHPFQVYRPGFLPGQAPMNPFVSCLRGPCDEPAVNAALWRAVMAQYVSPWNERCVSPAAYTSALIEVFVDEVLDMLSTWHTSLGVAGLSRRQLATIETVLRTQAPELTVAEVFFAIDVAMSSRLDAAEQAHCGPVAQSVRESFFAMPATAEELVEIIIAHLANPQLISDKLHARTRELRPPWFGGETSPQQPPLLQWSVPHYLFSRTTTLLWEVLHVIPPLVRFGQIRGMLEDMQVAVHGASEFFADADGEVPEFFARIMFNDPMIVSAAQIRRRHAALEQVTSLPQWEEILRRMEAGVPLDAEEQAVVDRALGIIEQTAFREASEQFKDSGWDPSDEDPFGLLP